MSINISAGVSWNILLAFMTKIDQLHNISIIHNVSSCYLFSVFLKVSFDAAAASIKLSSAWEDIALKSYKRHPSSDIPLFSYFVKKHLDEENDCNILFLREPR